MWNTGMMEYVEYWNGTANERQWTRIVGTAGTPRPTFLAFSAMILSHMILSVQDARLPMGLATPD